MHAWKARQHVRSGDRKQRGPSTIRLSTITFLKLCNHLKVHWKDIFRVNFLSHRKKINPRSWIHVPSKVLDPTIHLHTREAHIFINYSRHICLGHSRYLFSTDLCYLSSIWAHSAWRHYLVVPRHNLSSYGHREFAVVGPTAWNSLSDSDHHDRQFQTSAYNLVVFWVLLHTAH